MNPGSLWIPILVVLSIAFALIRMGSLSDTVRQGPWQVKFLNVWGGFVSFFLAGIIGYYFVLVRWPQFGAGKLIDINDILLMVFFAMSVFGHLPAFSRDITEGVRVLFKRVLER